MYDAIKNIVLKIMKVPAEPHDPMGDVKLLRVFRAAPNFFYYKLIGWVIAQAFLLPVSIAALVIFHVWVSHTFENGIVTLLFHLIGLFALVNLIAFTIFTYVMTRLDYEMRWYKVTDRSMRIRQGVFVVREMTLNFANIQQTTYSQGPIQRLLGIADIVVQTAGGGAMVGPHGEQLNNFHQGILHGVENAKEIQKLIEDRLRDFRDAGLGDLDDRHGHHDGAAHGSTSIGASPAVLEALRGLRDEASQFRAAAEGR